MRQVPLPVRLILCAVLCLVPAAAWAGEIVVTGLTSGTAVSSPEVSVTLNGFLVIKEIKVRQVGDRISLQFPEYVSRKKRVYPQVVLLTRQANEAVRKAVAGGKAEAGKAISTRFAISRFSPFRGRSVIRVLATVSFNDAVAVECKVMEGKNGPWIAWPSRKSKESGQWVRQVVFTDKRMKEAVEQALLERYDTLLSEEGMRND